MTAAAPEPVRLGEASGRWVVLATVLGSAVVMVTGTVVNVALPAIGEDLGAGVSGRQWVVTSYLLTLSALILLGGSLGDRYGRRRTFVIGVVGFAATSVACALAPSLPLLVAARVAQGAAGALLTPGSRPTAPGRSGSGRRSAGSAPPSGRSSAGSSSTC
jgi:MFS family permease